MNNDDYELSIREVLCTQAKNHRTTQEKTYHLLISFRPEDNGKLTESDYKLIEEKFAAVLGYSEHQRHCGVHINTDNVHIHISYNMIHPRKLTRIEPYRDFVKMQALCRSLEQEYGLAIDVSQLQNEQTAPSLSQGAAAIEAHTGVQSFESFAKEQAEPILVKLKFAESWEQVHAIFAERGLTIQKRGGGLVVTNRHGKQKCKASAISREMSLKKLESQYGAFQKYDKEKLPETKTRYRPKPIQKNPDRGNLWATFQEQKATQAADLDTISKKWKAYIERIEQQPLHREAKRHFLNLARQQAKVEKKEYRSRQPANWLAFLRKEAERGNEEALAVLRSRKVEVAPEVSTEKQQEQHLKLETDKANILARTDIDNEVKTALISRTIMQSIAQEAKSSITKHGEILYTMPDGGQILDMGNAVKYSPKGEETAIAFMSKKWGLQVKGFEKSPDGKPVIVLGNGVKITAKDNNFFERPDYKEIQKQAEILRVQKAHGMRR